MDITDRERTISEYFNSWLRQDGSGLRSYFAPDAEYIESWGPVYHGVGQIERWFADWNQSARVLAWPIKGFIHQGALTAVAWYFECTTDDGVAGFDGVSLVEFDVGNRIVSLKEFQSKTEHTFPYGSESEA